MFRYLFILLLSFNSCFANENIVKTSELELFLFKVGFESLLKDVDITKNKSSLNEKEIKTLNEKVELIMTELYKNKRVLLNDSIENEFEEKEFIKKESLNSVSIEEFNILKNEIVQLKKELGKLNVKKEKELKKTKNTSVIKMRVASSKVNIYRFATTESETIRSYKRDTILLVEYCKKGWCKLKDEKFFVRKFLIKEYE